MSTTINQKIFPQIFIIPLILLSMISLAACQNSSDQNQANDIDHQILDRRLGSIESLNGIHTSNQGTHLLKMEDGSTILLKSLAINLDDPKYNNKIVDVSGILNYTTDKKQIMEVDNIDIVADIIKKDQKPISWQDYVNTKLGISLRYRNDFELEEQPYTITFIRPVNLDTGKTQQTQTSQSSSMENSDYVLKHIITVNVIPHQANTNLNQYLKLNSDSTTDLLTAGFTKSKIGPESLDALKKNSNDGTTIDFYLDKNDQFYHISFQGGKDNQSLEDQNIFYELLSSFHILKGDGSDIKTDGDILNNLGSTQQTPPLTNKSLPIPVPTTSGSTPTPIVTPKPIITPDPVVTPTPQPTAPTTTPAIINGTQQLMTGYSLFESPSYKFSLQYPKSWYYSNGTSTDSNVIRHYDFDTKAFDQQGSMALDIVSGGIPSGSTINAGNKTVTRISSDGLVQIYVKGNGSRVYRLTGPVNQETSLLNMAATLQD